MNRFPIIEHRNKDLPVISEEQSNGNQHDEPYEAKEPEWYALNCGIARIEQAATRDFRGDGAEVWGDVQILLQGV